ncbi:hypothetical protein GQX73_g10776 [Xylaria multiplex]|uniref:FAD-binding PCMH-type domain-containing protein n=1 Tax=Xylaria multiplex TaxID=323545 RepID=A0A7C8IJ17_9PEZI|nr:hypothetical protein GQX73_g10776 [Xylaria multiplex]
MMLKTAAIVLTSCLLVPQLALGLATRQEPQTNYDLAGLVTSMRWSAQTTVSFPGQTRFVNVTQRWTTFCAHLGTSPLSAQETREISSKLGIPFLVTSGRHGFNPTLGGLRNGLAIDLSRFDKLQINARANTLTIGPAIRTSDLLRPLYNAGFIGITLGGGIGRWDGVYGLFTDALESVRFIAANGTALTASRTVNSELFWGIRGAGANLGVITEATYNLRRIARSEKTGSGYGLNADFTVPASQNATYFKLLEKISPYPARLAIVTVVVWNQTIGQTQIVSNWQYFGPRKEALVAIAPMIALGPSVSSIRYLPWPELFYAQQFGMDGANCAPGLVRNIYTASIRKITSSTWQSSFGKMARFFEGNPSARALTSFAHETYPNQATVAVPDDETAYPWRDAKGYLLFQFGWSGAINSPVAATAAALGRELRADYAATSGYEKELKGGLAAYVNYARGDEPLENIYRTDKLPRLAALKRTWDPNNVFAYHLALPTRYPAAP